MGVKHTRTLRPREGGGRSESRGKGEVPACELEQKTDSSWKANTAPPGCCSATFERLQRCSWCARSQEAQPWGPRGSLSGPRGCVGHAHVVNANERVRAAGTKRCLELINHSPRTSWRTATAAQGERGSARCVAHAHAQHTAPRACALRSTHHHLRSRERSRVSPVLSSGWLH